jgi:large subunit ribosomal protein L21e
MKHSKGKMTKRTRLLGFAKRRLTIPDLLSTYEVGDTVAIDPQVRYSGLPHGRYRGKTGKIIGKRGKAYEVKITDGDMEKILIVPPVHLRKV